jgi:tetratricopeptide (TPR) repeat protein
MKPTIFFCLLCLPSLAQVYTPPPGGNSPAPANQSSQGGGDTTINRPQQQNSAPLVGNEVPFIDPSAETVSFNGRNFAIADNRLFAARFERYLNEPEDNSDEAIEYRKTIDEILALVSPHNPAGPNLYAAFKLLPKASNYPGDAKLCDSLSQAVYVAMVSRKNVEGSKKLMEALEEEKQRVIREADWKAATERDLTLNQTGSTTGGGGGGNNNAGGGNTGGGGGNNGGGQRTNGGPGQRSGPATDPGRGTQSLLYADMQRRILEIEALKTKNELKGEVQIVQAKVQYQALMMQFFMQRRFQHVLMASRFYNQIWTDGDSKLHIDKNSDTSKLFNESVGFSPTVASLDSFSSEFIRDCDKGVEAFNFLADKGELESAAKRLSEAYAVGEFMPGVRTLPRDRKRKVLEFVRESYKLLAAIDVKDYAQAEKISANMKTMASDYNGNKADAAIATYTRVSNMHIMTAKTHAATNEIDKAREEIKKAMEVWPQNPKLAEFDQLIESGSTLVTAKNDFDRLLSENNYRQIFADQYRIAPAIQTDPQRLEAFKQIIGNLTSIEASIGKANEFSKMGQDYAAWEQLALVREKFPDDPKLGRELELLAPKVADFTKALDRARTFEKRMDKQTGSAMAWYLKAQKIYPQSLLAKEGVERLLTVILPNDSDIKAPVTQEQPDEF